MFLVVFWGWEEEGCFILYSHHSAVKYLTFLYFLSHSSVVQWWSPGIRRSPNNSLVKISVLYFLSFWKKINQKCYCNLLKTIHTHLVMIPLMVSWEVGNLWSFSPICKKKYCYMLIDCEINDKTEHYPDITNYIFT